MYGKVVSVLKEKNLTVTFAESCTGGYLAKSVTDIPGSSAVFNGSVIAYSNEIKRVLLGVQPATLEKYGAVSSQTAFEMARGVKRLFNADIAVSVTGIAGPDGGTPEKPVGLVYVAVATNYKTVIRRIHIGSGNASRDCIRQGVVRLAAYYIIRAAEEMTAPEKY